MMKQFTLIIITCMVLSCSNQKAKNSTLLVGASSATINPEAGAFIAGDKHDRHFTGIHDSIFVKSIVISNADNHFAILTFDCIGMLHPTLVEIRKAVALRIPLSQFDPNHIVMASTHTHSGPDVVGIWGAEQTSSGVDSVYMKELVKTAVDVLVAAWTNRQEVSVYTAESTFGNDWVYNISEPDELDRSVSILQFKDRNENSVATLTNFACHPTILDGASTLVSSDYVAGLYKQLNHTIGGENLFLQGSIGGWVQPEHEEKSFNRAYQRGNELGKVVIDGLMKGSHKTEDTKILFKSTVFQLPVSNPGFQQLSALHVIKRTITDSVQTEIAWFSLGEAQFVTHPGETVPAYSVQSKALMELNGPKFVIGLGMDALGYILKPTFFNPEDSLPHAEYLTGMSIDKEAGPLLMRHITKLPVSQE